MKIVYMGTPEFAVLPLKRLCDNNYQVVLVVSQPDKARDRGKKIQSTPVKEMALKYGIEVIQPDKIKDNEDFIDRIKNINPDLIVVAAYGKILPKELLQIPRLGCINIHASLLPKYRGAAPIHRCIIDGETITGVTLMYMEEGLDTGDMIVSQSTEINQKTMAELHDELSSMGARLLIDMLPKIEEGTNVRLKQEAAKATYAPMVFKKDGQVNFDKSPEETERLIRGMNSWPGAYTMFRGEQMKLWQAEATKETTDKPSGTITEITEQGIKVAAGGRILLISKIQLPGKKSMRVSEFIKGNKILIGEILG